jgi:hypothetical protein
MKFPSWKGTEPGFLRLSSATFYTRRRNDLKRHTSPIRLDRDGAIGRVSAIFAIRGGLLGLVDVGG